MESSRWVAPRGVVLAIVLATAFAYAPGLGAPFTFDDVAIVEHAPIREGFAGLAAALRQGYWQHETGHPGNEYRPLTSLSFSYGRALFGGEPWRHRAVNLALHVTAAWLVYGLARRLGGSDRAAALAALLFAVHPLHVEAVTGLVGRSELLQTVFALAALRAFLAQRRRMRLAWPWLLLAAVLSKESAITAPLAFLGTAAWLRARTGEPRRLLEPEDAILLPLLVGYFLARTEVLGALTGNWGVGIVENPLVETPLAGRVPAGAFLLARYAALSALPVRLSSEYGYDAFALIAPGRGLVLGAALVGWLIAVLAAVLRPRSLYAWALGWFLVSLAVVSNVPFPIGTIFGERLAYAASVACAVLVGALAARALDRADGLAAAHARVAVALLVGLLTIRTATRNLDFRSEEALFRAASETCPRSVKARYGYGMQLALGGDLGAADHELAAAARILPSYAPARGLRARVLLALKRPDEAAAESDAALAADPREFWALAVRGDLLRSAGRCEEAVPLYRRALERKPGERFAEIGLARCGAGPAG